ncbi:MAG: hypothetical protein LBF58_09515 [Deltaproteobacteria bacterium]|jgi:tetratricopeptide (TPR) repeat protein|nr:hypothetical protein [Deltaproteobacteria bacterium]
MALSARTNWARLVALALAGLFWAGCSWLPKVHLISDPLSKEEHLGLALTYEKDGELEIAEREYRAALPLAMAYLGLANVIYQRGEVGEALAFYRRAWQLGKIPAAANNLAWVLLLEGGSLAEALEMAGQAVSQAEADGLDQALIDNYRGTLGQVEQAIKADERRKGQEAAEGAPKAPVGPGPAAEGAGPPGGEAGHGGD